MHPTALISPAEELQLKTFGNFLDAYDKKLNKMFKNHFSRSHSMYKSMQVSIEPLIELDYCSNQEQLDVLELLESDSLINKTVLTFAYLCTEVKQTIEESEQLQSKLIFIDEDHCVTMNAELAGEAHNSENRKTERILLKMSAHMQFFCRVQLFLQRCIVLGNNMMHQCAAFLAADERNYTLEFKLFNVFDCFADLLLQLLIFDEVLAKSNFARHWDTYQKTVDTIGNNEIALALGSAAEINGLKNSLQQLDFLFAGTVFRNFMDSTFALKDKVEPSGMARLAQQCNTYIKQNLASFNKINASELNAFDEPQQLVRLNAFCVVFHDFCGQIESKHMRTLLELNAKHAGIVLLNNIGWCATSFFLKNGSAFVKAHEKLLLQQDIKRHHQHFLNTRVQTLPRDCHLYCTQVVLWTLNMRKVLDAGSFQFNVAQFKELSTLLLLGLRYAGQISFILKALVHAHVALQTAMSKQTLLAICKLIEMLKMIQQTMQKDTDKLSKAIHCVLQYWQCRILHLLSACKKKLITSKVHERNADSLAAIKIAEKCMNGPTTQARILVIHLAVNASNLNNRTFSQEQYEQFRSIMQRIERLSSFQKHLQNVCDTSFIYWHQSILTNYLKNIVERKMDFNSFVFPFSCVDQCAKHLNSLQMDDLKLTSIVKRSNYETIRSEIISNLCAQTETFLRLEVHLSLQHEKISPLEQSNIDDYRELIHVSPFVVNGQYVVLKDHIENYLSAMFYNLTTISLHDWKTYEEMRHLANHRLMLQPVDDYLPNQTLEQGIDILEIMRKIHIFVSKYVYNMNSQIFVEQRSANKHLDTIGIKHVANSLRTHGAGVINTTVNFTYQFLRQKFYTFSQFLYDEQIKSRLMKELRSFADKKHSDSYPLYPYERADSFIKDIRKLGLSQDSQTYMDLFRKVITHVGNAMGYIRLVRSGSIHANYSASLYLPKFDENLKFVESCKGNRFNDVTQKAAENFEVNIKNLSKSFSDSTDYFKLLVAAFQPFFRNPHNMHLKNFFLIVPPLTLNYVEYMLRVKDNINKKDRNEAVLFDDGFAVGLTYILKLLHQLDEFNALQWFTTVRERFESERCKIRNMLAELDTTGGAKSSGSNIAAQRNENEKLQQTLALTERRINAHQLEFNLLFYSLSSSKVFFN